LANLCDYLSTVATKLGWWIRRTRTAWANELPILPVYRDLCELHCHAFISKEKAKNILTAMQVVLNKWLEEIG